MSLNIELLLVLAMEQQQALLTVDRCSSEITRLLTEQQQRNRALQATEHRNLPDETEPTPGPWPGILASQSIATKRQRLETDSSDEELKDEVLLEAVQQHELSTSAQPAQSTSPGQQSVPTAAQHKAIQMPSQPATWSRPEQPKHYHDKPAGIE